MKKYILKIDDKEIEFEINRVAKQAASSVVVKSGTCWVLCAVTFSEKPRTDVDFTPLTVDYIERMYAIGRIPGGFIKKEGKPSDNEILKARLIDRTIRPLIDHNFFNDINVYVNVFSADIKERPEILGLLGTSLALLISPIPFYKPVSAFNITNENIDLVVSSIEDKITMIEAKVNEIDEEFVFNLISQIFQKNKLINEFQYQIYNELKPDKIETTSIEIPPLLTEMYQKYFKELNLKLLNEKDKKQRNILMDEISLENLINLVSTNETDEVKNQFNELINSSKITEFIFNVVKKKFLKKYLKEQVLNEKRRIDGRDLKEIRPIEIEIGVLPYPHGSALFTRGQTQVLSVVTLGTKTDQQMIEGLILEEEFKRYMHHYYFPPFSTGEAKPLRAPSRREIGHGNLAERALEYLIPSEQEFPYTIRVVSEVLESNGSTSMASVCGSSLALMDAGVPIKKHVAGVSIGLITNDKNINDYVLLTDIQGFEDFFGEMDFKVAGTYNGITAIQMDTKLEGLTLDIVYNSLKQAKEGRDFILEKMYNVISKPNDLAPHAPRVTIIQVEPSKIPDIIGPQGKIIKKIIEQTKVKIDIEEDGRVLIYSSSEDDSIKAKSIIEAIVNIKEGNVYLGRIIRLEPYGAFVEVAPGKIGLLHVSELGLGFVSDARTVLKLNDEIVVKILKIDENGRFTLTRKGLVDSNIKSLK
ncbi:MAG: polyribonucleotide nucleotidyltransferase [bacterium]|nr:polyribonucleotide nucleotidyltransferase [bacterium]